MHSTIRKPLVSGFFLFICLVAWSISSPISSGLDSVQHLATVFCANGEAPGRCQNIRIENSVLVADVAYFNENAPINPNGTQTFQITSQAEQNLFYKFMNLFVTHNVTKSVLSMRFFNALLFTCICVALLLLKQKKFRVAAATSFTFTLVPVLISSIPQVNPRSWAVISVMSSWLFLAAALESVDKTEKVRLWFFYFLSIVLAISSRWDAALFVLFTTSVVLIRYFTIYKSFDTRKLMVRIAFFSVVFLLVRSFSETLAQRTKFQFFNSYPKSQFTFFQIVHIPENIADGLGLGIRYFDIGPNVIGIIGVALFSITLAFNLRGANQVTKLLSALTLTFIFIVMFRMSAIWNTLAPPVGAYTASLLTFLLGLTAIDNSEKNEFYSSRSWKYTFVSLIAYSHFLSLFSRFEWSTTPTELREQIGTYSIINLSSGWWWNTFVPPLAVLVIGSTAFFAWLLFSWNWVVKDQPISINRTTTSVTP